MSINTRGRIYTNRLMNIYREFYVTVKKSNNTHMKSLERDSKAEMKDTVEEMMEEYRTNKELTILTHKI